MLLTYMVDRYFMSLVGTSVTGRSTSEDCDEVTSCEL